MPSMTRPTKLVVTSGYFNPIGSHHLDYLMGAKHYWNYGGHDVRHVCIVNNDEQVKLKGSCPFQNFYERSRIVMCLEFVDEVFRSTDIDRTVRASLETIFKRYEGMKLYFMNGGDRRANSSETAEEKVCAAYNATVIYGVGGHQKTGSSSGSLERATKWYTSHHY